MRPWTSIPYLFLFVVAGLISSPLPAASPHAGSDLEAVAEIDGQTVTWSELEAFAAPQLREIDKKRSQILEANLNGLIEQKLLEREANRRQVTIEELVTSEISAQAEPVTDAEVDAWYEQNKARMRQPKEAVADQVRAFLEEQRADPLRRELVAGLRQRYDVQVHLEPLRVDIEASSGPAKGPQEAAVTVVEFSDFQCPACARLQGDFRRLKETYSDRVRFEFRQFPLTGIHPQAFKASEAALCASDQGQFWEMHDVLFARQRELSVEQLKTRANELGLDSETFAECLDSGTYREQVQDDLKVGRMAGVTGTPTIFVNGRPVTLLRGVAPFDVISATIDDELQRAAVE